MSGPGSKRRVVDRDAGRGGERFDQYLVVLAGRVRRTFSLGLQVSVNLVADALAGAGGSVHGWVVG